MEVVFANTELEEADKNGECPGRYSAAIFKAFQKVMRFIRAATDERDFRSMRSLNFEQLKGNREHQHSLRLNVQWRLIIEIKSGNPKNTIVVVAIEDYH